MINMEYDITEEERKNIVDVNGKECMVLYRGTSIESYRKHIKDGYYGNRQPMSFTTDKKIAEEYASYHKEYWNRKPIVLEVYIPTEIVFGEDVFFEREWEETEKEYSSYWQIPLAWIKGYHTENGFMENPDFDPGFVPEKRKLDWPYYDLIE